MKMIDLGKKEPDYGEPAMAPVASDKKQKTVVRYPSLYISDRKVEAPDAGAEGTATIKYRIREKSEAERQTSDGKTTRTCNVELDIMSIAFDPIKGSAKKSMSADDEIEEGLSKAEGKSTKED